MGEHPSEKTSRRSFLKYSGLGAASVGYAASVGAASATTPEEEPVDDRGEPVSEDELSTSTATAQGSLPVNPESPPDGTIAATDYEWLSDGAPGTDSEYALRVADDGGVEPEFRFSTADDLTIDFFWRYDSGSSLGYLFNDFDSASAGFRAFTNGIAGSGLFFRNTFGGSDISISGDFQDGDWYQIRVVLDSEDSSYTVYIDGEQVGQSEYSETGWTADDRFRVMGRQSGSSTTADYDRYVIVDEAVHPDDEQPIVSELLHYQLEDGEGETVTNGFEPTIDRIAHSPDVPETTDELLFGAVVDGPADETTDVSLVYDVADGTDGTLDMEPVSDSVPVAPFGWEIDSVWMTSETQPSSIGAEAGDRVEYHVEVEYEGGTVSSDTQQFYAFEVVETVGTVYAMFDDSTAGGDADIDPLRTGEELTQRQEELATTINEYMASWKGPWGAIGYDFTFLDNDGDWYAVDEESVYYDGLGDDADSDFREDALDAAADSEPAFSDGDDLYDQFDNTISVSPGDANDYSLSNLRVHHRRAHATRGDPPVNRIFVNEGAAPYGTWIHELGHTIGHRDLYQYDDPVTGGEINLTGIMGSGTNIEPPAPFATVSRTEYHRLYPQSLEDDRETWPWLEPNVMEGFEFEFDVDALEAMDLGDSVQVYEPPGGGTPPHYVFGARGTEKDTSEGTVSPGVYLYRVSDRDSSPNRIDHISFTELESSEWGLTREPDANPTFGTADDEFEISFLLSSVYTTIRLVETTGSEDTYTATMAVTEPDISNMTVFSIELPSFPSLTESEEIDEPPEPVIQPELRVHAYDSDGNHVGLNYETGTYETEIPGVTEDDVSWPLRGTEWIAVPDDLDVRFEVDAVGVETWLDWLEDTTGIDPEATGGDTLETTVTVRTDRYGANPQYDPETATIEDHATVARELSITPGETTTGSVPATVNIEPQTINLSSSGNWITAKITLPDDDVAVESIDLSTLELNGDVAAVDDGPGFTDDPVSGDTFVAKFPREEVGDVLETGEDVRVTVTGVTSDDTVISGDDHVTVIDNGRGNGNNNGNGN